MIYKSNGHASSWACHCHGNCLKHHSCHQITSAVASTISALSAIACWWSLWILFALFEFAWNMEVSAIINSAKIEMILRLLMLPESNQMVKERSRIVLYPFCTSQHRFLLMRYQILYRNWRFEDPRDLIEDLEHILHVPWSIFLVPFPPYHLRKRNSFLR